MLNVDVNVNRLTLKSIPPRLNHTFARVYTRSTLGVHMKSILEILCFFLKIYAQGGNFYIKRWKAGACKRCMCR